MKRGNKIKSTVHNLDNFGTANYVVILYAHLHVAFLRYQL